MKIQNSTAKIWNFGFPKNLNWVSGKWEIGAPKPEFRFRFPILGITIQNLFPKLKNLHLKTWNSISILNFGAGNLIFKKIPKSFSLISFESEFETIKFEISDVEKPQFYFFFDQNLDFVLGTGILLSMFVGIYSSFRWNHINNRNIPIVGFLYVAVYLMQDLLDTWALGPVFPEGSDWKPRVKSGWDMAPSTYYNYHCGITIVSILGLLYNFMSIQNWVVPKVKNLIRSTSPGKLEQNIV